MLGCSFFFRCRLDHCCSYAWIMMTHLPTVRARSVSIYGEPITGFVRPRVPTLPRARHPLLFDTLRPFAQSVIPSIEQRERACFLRGYLDDNRGRSHVVDGIFLRCRFTLATPPLGSERSQLEATIGFSNGHPLCPSLFSLVNEKEGGNRKRRGASRSRQCHVSLANARADLLSRVDASRRVAASLKPRRAAANNLTSRVWLLILPLPRRLIFDVWFGRGDEKKKGCTEGRAVNKWTRKKRAAKRVQLWYRRYCSNPLNLGLSWSLKIPSPSPSNPLQRPRPTSVIAIACISVPSSSPSKI